MERHINEIFDDPYYGSVICLSADAFYPDHCVACIYRDEPFSCGNSNSLMGLCTAAYRTDKKDVYFDWFP